MLLTNITKPRSDGCWNILFPWDGHSFSGAILIFIVGQNRNKIHRTLRAWMENYLIETTKLLCLILNIKVEMKKATLKHSCPQCRLGKHYRKSFRKQVPVYRRLEQSNWKYIQNQGSSYFEDIVAGMDASCAKTEVGKSQFWSLGLSPQSSVHMNRIPLPLTLWAECNSSHIADWFLPMPGFPLDIEPWGNSQPFLVLMPSVTSIKEQSLKPVWVSPVGWGQLPGWKWEIGNGFQYQEETPPRKTYMPTNF